MAQPPQQPQPQQQQTPHGTGQPSQTHQQIAQALQQHAQAAGLSLPGANWLAVAQALVALFEAIHGKP
jgi:predicted component of type VI protein secretion system